MGRKSKNKPLRKEIRIYCEGKTEKIYFDLLKQKYRLPNIKVKTKGELGQSVELVNHVLRSLNKMSANEKKKIEKILVVFDKDDDSWESIEKAYALAKQNNIGICFSNECFELWLLAHFEKIQKEKRWTRKLLYLKLTQILEVRSYEDEKANKTIIQRIFTNIDAVDSNCEYFTDDFKKMNYCDMKKTIAEIFESNFQ
ncbi:RloB domain-containing protein [Enterococcus durans]|uniref:RloB family protein n=1 Tax=Enterococcus durans TaxID=53345 RepID=UPI0011BEC13D|nr:RloB family protein [Enterococcus durans]QED60855.1 RloB domain-containing protein [Enterococcus durans]QED63453.1 RloB domain-containing protein [Enterococcus durans]